MICRSFKALSIALAGLLAAGCSASGVPAIPQGGASAATTDFGRPHAASYKVVHAFGASDGIGPAGGVTAAGGLLYGTTTGGVSGGCPGTGCGTIFAVDPAAGTEEVIYQFTGTADGSDPYGPPIASGGVLYGVAQGGGPYSHGSYTGGTLYRLNISADKPVETTLHAFGKGKDGKHPVSGLTLAGNTLYGTTSLGGNFGAGTIFSIHTDGSNYMVLHSFGAPGDGRQPLGALTQFNGVLYGTANQGGTRASGTFFSLATNGSGYKTLYSFKNGADGNGPRGNLLYAGGKFYGTTYAGGRQQNGTLYEITHLGVETVIFTFGSGLLDPRNPQGGLTLDQSCTNCPAPTTVYGLTDAGGSVGSGTIYSYDFSTKKAAVLHYFGVGSDGSGPSGGLASYGGALYGVTYTGGESGGVNAQGTVFKAGP